VTVGYNQFCISQVIDEQIIVHGDCPVSFLTKAEIGDVRDEKFHLSVFMKNKGGKDVTVKTFLPDYGYLHPVAEKLIA